MYVDIAFQVLVIILSVVLTVFLIVAIVLLVKATKIVGQIKRVGDSIEKAAEDMSGMARGIRSVVTPAVVTKLIASLVEQITSRGEKKGKEK